MISEGPAPAAFADLSGAIGVSIKYSSSGEWPRNEFQFHNGQVIGAPGLPEPDAYAASLGGSVRADWAPEEFGLFEIPANGPYQKSPDGRYLAAKAHVRFPEYGPRSAGVIIVDLSNDEVVAHIDSEDARGVHAIAWSPDGRHIAMVGSHIWKGRCHLKKIAYMVGYPVTIKSLYLDFVGSLYLDVVDLAGNVVASADLALGVEFPTGRVVWREAPDG